MGYGASQSNVERWRCEGDVGSFVWTAKGTKDYSGRGEVFGRIEGGNQRRDCEGEKNRGGYSFQSVLHGTQCWKQVPQNLALQEPKQSNSQVIFPNEGCNNSYTNNQTSGLCYSTGSGKGLSSLESERGLTEVYGIQVQRESVLQRWPIFWLELESITILQNYEINSQSNQGEIYRESGTIHGRPADLIIRKEITGMRYSLDNLIHEGAGLEDLEVENLYDGSMHPTGQEKVVETEVEKMVRDYDGEEDSRGQKVSTAAGRVELSEIASNGCISTYGANQSSEDRSVEETRMELQVEVGQENVGGFVMVVLGNQGEQSKDVRFENTYILPNSGFSDNRIGSGIGINGGDE
ncbi:MAG: hypothetical protein EZS28_048625 [Streblomastix strix]|uniref:Uncharacterized protein n=1 Tax=Streblomastix strix TaxID=222440 RepID=A0A5J4TC54_9EUKA|nr:MAG: hypothetical protein EZS28_048625 [Streblomastix strix]